MIKFFFALALLSIAAVTANANQIEYCPKNLEEARTQGWIIPVNTNFEENNFQYALIFPTRFRTTVVHCSYLSVGTGQIDIAKTYDGLNMKGLGSNWSETGMGPRCTASVAGCSWQQQAQ